MAAGAFAVTADVERYDEAADWFLKRTVIPKADALALDDRLKHEAFWVGGGLQLAQVQRVFDSIDVAIEKGESFEDWRKRVRDTLVNDAHAETVFRNATQRAYNAGRYTQMREPSVARFRPFWLFDAILDGRQTVVCEACNGVLLPHDDPWWDTHVPPLHHRCRSSIRNLRKSQADKHEQKRTPRVRDPKGAPGEDGNAKPGWGHAPDTATAWKPDPGKTDPKLIEVIEAKAVAGTKARKPRTPKAAKPKLDLDTWVKHYEPKYGAEAAKSVGHGRAALELGLDLPVSAVREELQQVDSDAARVLLDALKGAGDEQTLRAFGGELEPRHKTAAALAGHLRTLKKRTKPLAHAALEADAVGKRGLAFMSRLTPPKLKGPGKKWRFVRKDGAGSYCNGPLELIQYNGARTGALEHELGHAIEHLNPELLARAVEFLKVRAKESPLVDHAPNGECWDDDFYHFYAGRKYARPDGTLHGTELTSTGLELLFADFTWWGNLGDWVKKDPEHFLFVLGQLAGP